MNLNLAMGMTTCVALLHLLVVVVVGQAEALSDRARNVLQTLAEKLKEIEIDEQREAERHGELLQHIFRKDHVKKDVPCNTDIATSDPKTLYIAAVCDKACYLAQQRSETAVQKFISDVVKEASNIHKDQLNLTLVLTGIEIHTKTQAFTYPSASTPGSDISANLLLQVDAYVANEFSQNWKYDVFLLFTGLNVPDNGLIRVQSVCKTATRGLPHYASGLIKAASGTTLIAARVALAHEIGHAVGMNHVTSNTLMNPITSRVAKFEFTAKNVDEFRNFYCKYIKNSKLTALRACLTPSAGDDAAAALVPVVAM